MTAEQMNTGLFGQNEKRLANQIVVLAWVVGAALWLATAGALMLA